MRLLQHIKFLLNILNRRNLKMVEHAMRFRHYRIEKILCENLIYINDLYQISNLVVGVQLHILTIRTMIIIIISNGIFGSSYLK